MKLWFETFGDVVKLRGPKTSNRPSSARLQRPASANSISSNAPEFGQVFAFETSHNFHNPEIAYKHTNYLPPKARWPVQSRQHASQQEARLQGSSWPPRQLANLLQPLEESRSLTGTFLCPVLIWSLPDQLAIKLCYDVILTSFGIYISCYKCDEKCLCDPQEHSEEDEDLFTHVLDTVTGEGLVQSIILPQYHNSKVYFGCMHFQY